MVQRDREPGGQLAARFDELGYILRNDLRRTLAGLSSLAKTLSDTAYRLAHENPSSLIMGAKSEKK